MLKQPNIKRSLEIKLNLITPHLYQRQIVDSCLDPSIFFTVAVVGRQFGKTCIAENLVTYWGVNEANVKIMWVSPTDSQAQKVQAEIVSAIHHSGVIKSSKKSKGDTEIRFHNGSVILFRSAASEDSLRGESIHYLVIDEAAFVKREIIEGILMPMLNVVGRHCLFITTPKGKNYIYEYYQKGLTTSKWRSLRFSTLYSPLANPELLQLFKDTLPPKLYQQEIEAEFVDSSSDLFASDIFTISVSLFNLSFSSLVGFSIIVNLRTSPIRSERSFNLLMILSLVISIFF